MKFIVYGFKMSNGNAHRYIHRGYFEAAKKIGYETYWLDDADLIDSSFFEKSIILTEGWANNKLPVCKDSVYFIHHFGTEDKNQRYQHNIKYVCNNNKVFDLRFLCESFEDHNQKWNVKFNNIHRIDCCTFLENLNGYKAIYQPWATDLFSEEIDTNSINKYTENKIYFVGSVDKIISDDIFWGKKLDNYFKIMRFKLACDENNIPFELINYSNGERLSCEDYIKIYKKSLLCPDIRNQHKLEVGYIPCRVFKSISYGKLGMTDSNVVYKFFNELVAYHEDPYWLFHEGMKHKDNISMIKSSMELVKNNHTYTNRIIALTKSIYE